MASGTRVLRVLSLTFLFAKKRAPSSVPRRDVQANAFIGHPSSTMSTFIGRVRNALGLGHNYFFLARDQGGE